MSDTHEVMVNFVIGLNDLKRLRIALRWCINAYHGPPWKKSDKARQLLAEIDAVIQNAEKAKQP